MSKNKAVSADKFKKEKKPNAAEYEKEKAHAEKLGIKPQKVQEIFGTKAKPKSRKEAAEALIAWIRTLPKGKEK
jgi:hypothetical protein